jgi:hypothetical protein
MINRNSLTELAARGADFLKPAKWLAKTSIVHFYQARSEIFFPAGEWWKLPMQFKK